MRRWHITYLIVCKCELGYGIAEMFSRALLIRHHVEAFSQSLQNLGPFEVPPNIMQLACFKHCLLTSKVFEVYPAPSPYTVPTRNLLFV
jgi:hypothetical protein